MTQQSLDWFPVTYGEDRSAAWSWNPASATSTGKVTVYDPPCAGPPVDGSCPARSSTSTTGCEEAGAVVVSVTKVATGPMTEEEAAGIARFGDLTSYAPRDLEARRPLRHRAVPEKLRPDDPCTPRRTVCSACSGAAILPARLALVFGDLAHRRVGTSAQPRTSHGIADREWRCRPPHKNAIAALAHIGSRVECAR